MIYYNKTVDAIFKELKSSDKGLSDSEASTRLESYGLNVLPIKKEPLWKVIVEPFNSVFIAVLFVAAFVSLISHEPIEAIIVVSIILINALVFYTQHYATTKVLRSLKKYNVQNVLVIRDGKQIEVSSVMLVPGDILILGEGDRIPADARIVSTDGIQVNESSLTGESNSLLKNSKPILSNAEIYDQKNMLFQGTYILSGAANAIVVATGRFTEFGKIAELTTEKNTKSTLQVKIDQLISLIVRVVAVVSVVVFLLALLRGIPGDEAIRFVLSLSVAAVPEGLPVALTVIAVLGMKQMAKQKALVKSFKSIDDVGQITTIATDKTGTLTKNKLTLVDSWSYGNKQISDYARYTYDGRSAIDPLDIALRDSTPDTEVNAVDKFFAFDVETRMSGSYVAKDSILYIKGSPEHILQRCEVSEKDKNKIEKTLLSFAEKGYRVIGVGYADKISVVPKNLSDLGESTLNFVGLLAFADELRPEAKIAVQQALDAGISVRMITGDHLKTAYTIGCQVGIATSMNQVIDGSNLPDDEAELDRVVARTTVFARILPKDKFRILKSLKKTEITAMTGDGVNDVPALSNAHVGFAMGSGSDLAKDAGGIVLLDDNFATITNAIAEGRKIFSNIRKMLFYLLSTALGGVITMIGALVFGLPLPVTAIQILWVNLVTDTAMVLPLGLEAAEKGVMKQAPRSPNEPLLNRILLSRMILVSSTMAVVILLIVTVLHSQKYSEGHIQTVAFMALIVAQWVNAFNARSENDSILKQINKPNYKMLVGLSVAVALQAIVMVGPLKEYFGIQNVGIQTHLLYSGLMAVAVVTVVEIHKYFTRRSLAINHSLA